VLCWTAVAAATVAAATANAVIAPVTALVPTAKTVIAPVAAIVPAAEGEMFLPRLPYNNYKDASTGTP
jgi:hypothetical protein